MNIKNELNKIFKLENEISTIKETLAYKVSEVFNRYRLAESNRTGQRDEFTCIIPYNYLLDEDEWSYDGYNIIVTIVHNYPGNRLESIVPKKYFLNESALVEFEEECLNIKKQRETVTINRKERKDRELYEKLKKQFGDN